MVFSGISDIGETTQKELEDAGHEVTFLRGDMAEEAFCKKIVSEVTERYGRLDCLVNNAFSFTAKGLDATRPDWHRVMNVGPIAYATMAQHASPHLKKQKGASIVNMSSISAYIAQPNRWTYNAAKGAVVQLTRCMAMDLAPDIRVNTVSPGWIWTREVDKAAGYNREKWEPVWGKFHLLRRLGRVEEVASAVAFLLSDDASFIIGADLFVDGGYLAMGSEGLGESSSFSGSKQASRRIHMPNFPIVDAHLHVWDPGLLRYPWLDDIPLLNKPHLLDGYKSACGQVKVERMVFIQAECDFTQYREEADWVTSLAETDNRLQGIVPWAPLEKGEAARPELEVLASNKLIKGIRRIIQFEPDLEFCLQPDFIKGVQLLVEFNLHFEICITHIHMENTLKLVRRCPDVRFILDHIGKPDIRNQLMDPWREHIRQLSDMPKVRCKVSGLVTETDYEKWTREDLKPYIHHVVECFGFDRIMYGGDWPVAYQATEYPRWVEVLEWAVKGCTDGEMHKLFRENAIDFYRLPR